MKALDLVGYTNFSSNFGCHNFDQKKCKSFFMLVFCMFVIFLANISIAETKK